MIEHRHPKSGAPICGTLLPPMTELLPGDYYDANQGHWENNPTLATLVIQPGCQTLWVRPSGELSTLSQKGKGLLCYLSANKCLLAKDSWHWKAIPTLSWKNDGRMDWAVENPDCIPNLISRGFLLPHPHLKDPDVYDVEVYEVTQAGHKAARMLQ